MNTDRCAAVELVAEDPGSCPASPPTMQPLIITQADQARIRNGPNLTPTRIFFDDRRQIILVRACPANQVFFEVFQSFSRSAPEF